MYIYLYYIHRFPTAYVVALEAVNNRAILKYNGKIPT